MDSGVMLVTGGLGTLGRAVVEAAQAGGWQAVIIDQAETRAVAVGDTPVMGGIDLTHETITANAFATVYERFGRIDSLVNVAGGFRFETTAAGSMETWEDMIRTNLVTAVVASRAVVPYLTRRGGSIVNIGAASAHRGGRGVAAYAAAKSGVHRLTESLADELAPEGINVNAVLPGMIDTPANRSSMPDADMSTWVRPSDIAQVILFLASKAAAAVTGALLPVVGGVAAVAQAPAIEGAEPPTRPSVPLGAGPNFLWSQFTLSR